MEHKRRILYNDDADEQYLGYGYDEFVTREEKFLETRFGPCVGTQVDTFVWCVGNGATPPWGKGNEKLHPCLESSERATDLIVEAGHRAGMEVWGSLRMNDLHDAFRGSLAEANDPLKREHPEYLCYRQDEGYPSDVKESTLWTAFNFARPEVRQYRLEFIERNCRDHDFDGYELDFTRFPWFFRLGEEVEHVETMTEFIRQIRAITNEIRERRSRPLLLAQVLSSYVGQVIVLVIGDVVSPHHKDDLHPLRSQSGQGTRPLSPSMHVQIIGSPSKFGILLRPITKSYAICIRPSLGV